MGKTSHTGTKAFLDTRHSELTGYTQPRNSLVTTKYCFMQNEQNEVWATPDFEAIPANMECTAYSETL
jgi:hypothetical protein